MTNFHVGDIVWAKIIGYPPWPSVILNDIPKPSKNEKTKYFRVFFFGSNNYAWVPLSRLSNYESRRERNIRPQPFAYFNEAVAEAEEHVGRKRSNPDYEIRINEEFIQKEKKSNIGKVNDRERRVKRLTPKRILDNKNVFTSKLVFGVLGTGIIGGGIMKNLLKSGHLVNVWNRTKSKCDRIIDKIEGRHYRDHVKSFYSPRELLQHSNIVFICVSNQDISNRIFQDSFGINNPTDRILENKGVVQMTTMGPEYSQNLKYLIEKQGGKYLEAQIQGSKTEVTNGELLVLTAGDESLFFDCQSCFNAIGKTALYLNEVGAASKLNLILELIKGVNLAVLAEGLSLAERCGVPHKEFMEIFNASQLDSSYLKGKANLIIEKDFRNVEQSLKHMQMNLKLGLDFATSEGQAMFSANMANEIFKHCMRLEYGDFDAATIYMRNRH